MVETTSTSGSLSQTTTEITTAATTTTTSSTTGESLFVQASSPQDYALQTGLIIGLSLAAIIGSVVIIAICHVRQRK
jgi:hypothetical protein